MSEAVKPRVVIVGAGFGGLWAARTMITIGRNSAGVAIGNRTYKGFLAWFLWLTIHLFYLIGFRNRIMVFLNWAWDYLLYERAVRFVFPAENTSLSKRSSCASLESDCRQAGNRKIDELSHF